MDLLADICIIQQAFPQPRVLHLKWYNAMIKRAHEHADDFKVKFYKYKSVKFLGSSDAAWNNAGGFKSQAGYSIWACEENILEEGSKLSPIVWQSKKQQRVANSTLAAESMTCTTTIDELDYVSAIWQEMNDTHFDLVRWHHKDDKRDVYAGRRDGIISIDARCLFDSLQGVGTKIPSCKRTALEVALINENLQRSGHRLRWVPTTHMLSDCLTKVGKKSDMLYDIIKGEKYHLREGSNESTEPCPRTV